MRQGILIIVLVGLAFLALTGPARAQTVKDIGEFKTQSHVILIAEQNDTEVEIKQMEKFESNNRDWVPDVMSTSTMTFKRTQMFEVGGDTE